MAKTIVVKKYVLLDDKNLGVISPEMRQTMLRNRLYISTTTYGTRWDPIKAWINANCAGFVYLPDAEESNRGNVLSFELEADMVLFKLYWEGRET